MKVRVLRPFRKDGRTYRTGSCDMGPEAARAAHAAGLVEPLEPWPRKPRRRKQED